MPLQKIEVWVDNALLANDGLESIEIGRDLTEGYEPWQPKRFSVRLPTLRVKKTTVDQRYAKLTCSDAYANRVTIGDTLVIRYPGQPPLFSGPIRTAYPASGPTSGKKTPTRAAIEAWDQTPYVFKAVYSALDLPAGVLRHYWPRAETTMAAVDYLEFALDLEDYWPGRNVVLPSVPDGVLEGILYRIRCKIAAAAFDLMSLDIVGTH
jgi:hypothetical protein